ncbi:MAG TPA: hypothetical protein DCP28_09240 [Cytophagales bacterium]|nr:hypothetical protein [Cytophagales bacterium]
MMKKFLLALIFCGLAGAGAQAQDNPYAEDHESVDALLTALYEVISGPQGYERDWDRFRAMFVEGARLMPTGTNSETGVTGMRVWSPDDYASFAGERLMGMGFYETELHRETDSYGPIMHVFSTYESRHDPSEEPFVRGINSIQLLNDGERWWIVSIYWFGETEAHPIPKQYGGE